MSTTGHESEAINVQGLKASLQKLKTNHIDGKAGKSTTLAGYGITDAYTKSETYTKTEVNGLVDTPHQEYATVDAYASLPATGSKDTIYRVSNYNGSTSHVDASVYSEYAWDGSQYVFLCVKSQIGEVFDISVYNNNAKYADLAAALNGGANIPQSLQKGGMSVKFVQSSDNKYMQYRCMAQNFTTDVTQWQGVDDEPTAGSDNLVKSGGVASCLNQIKANYSTKVISNNEIVNSVLVESYCFDDLHNVVEIYFHKGNLERRIHIKYNDDSVVLYNLFIQNDGTFIATDFATNSILKWVGVVNLDMFDANCNIYHNVSFKRAISILGCSPMSVLMSLLKPSNLKTITYTKTTSKRIKNDGTVESAGSGWFYSSPVAVKCGDIISMRDVAGNNNVAIASYVITEDESYEKLQNVKYSGVDHDNYTFVVDKDGYIAFSLIANSSYSPSIYSISSDTIRNLISVIKLTGAGNPIADNTEANQVGAASVEVAKVGENLIFKFKNLKGQPGSNGTPGQQGPQGEQGNSGYSGAAGELEVVNNLEDGGATAALSAEQGKKLKRYTDLNSNFNDAPCIPKPVRKRCLSSTPDLPASWTASNNGTVEQNRVKIFDEVNCEVLDCVKFNCHPLASGSAYSEFKANLSSAVNLRTTAMCGSIYIDPTIADADRGSILIKLFSANGYATIFLWYLNPSHDGRTLYSRNYWYHFSINADAAANSRTSQFDVTNVTAVSILYENAYNTSPYIATTGISFVEQLHKPAISIVVDNYNPSVPNMADYAASKGIKLTTTIVPSYIGGANSASLDRINDGKLQGNLIGNHTWSHRASLETESAYIEEIQKAETYMLNNGFIRGCKFISVPSGTFNNLKYLAYCKTNAQMIYHSWISGPPSIVVYPYYPCQREHCITKVDNNPSTPEAAATVVAAMKTNIQNAITYNGMCVLGFHGTFWDADNGVAWKDLIDYISQLEEINIVTVDDLIEGKIV